MQIKNRRLLTVLGGLLVAASLLAPLEGLHAAPPQEKETREALVSINKANASELESLRGIGPMLAERIVKYRDANGRFEQLEDLTQVPGIGQSKFEKIKSQLTL